MTDKATLIYDGDEYEFDVLPVTIGNRGIDIRNLRSASGDVTFDPGFANTAGTTSTITYVDGSQGTLRHRGYAIEDLAANCTFLEVSYLLLFGELPTAEQLDEWTSAIGHHTLISEEMKAFFNAFPVSAHPMAILSSAANAISTFYDAVDDSQTDDESYLGAAMRLLAKMPTVAAWSYKKSIGQPYVYPNNDLTYVENFLNMMFETPAEDLYLDPVIVRALNVLLILHADHGQNCSTATVRFVGSSQANLFASVAAGMGALWGPLHGGANQAVIEMLQTIHDDPNSTPESIMARAKDKDDPFRLMGFGHRVYKNYDPRARLLQGFADEVLAMVGDDPLLEIARALETLALEDDYFVSRNLYPNVDFYSGILFRALGFPPRMFTVLFAIGRLPGWIANWKEMSDDPMTRIARPRQLYMGQPARPYVPIEEREAL
jgi:citrate synthase